jgi:acetyltransferase-like isoleucine patch superfamily enzyme
MFAMKSILLKLYLKSIIIYRRFRFSVKYLGKSIKIDPSSWVSGRSVIRVNGGGSIVIGKNCEIHDFSMILTSGGDISIGDNCSVNPFTIIYGVGGASIGNNVRIAAHTVIVPGNHNPGNDDLSICQAGITKKGVRIDDNVWIGAGVRILDGVHIGRNTIVGAGSVVTNSLPPNATVVGVPAKVQKIRTG